MLPKKSILDSASKLPKKPRNQAIKSIIFGILTLELAFYLCLCFGVSYSFPGKAEASMISFVSGLLNGNVVQKVDATPANSQTMSLLQATLASDPNAAKGGGDITVVGGTSLQAESGPSGTGSEIDNNSFSTQISTYVVRDGDTLGSIAKMFNVSVNTLVWANDIKGKIITPGQNLVILPVSGIQYTVKKGDTIASIAKKLKSDTGEISQYNGLSSDADLAAGDTLLIPDAELEGYSDQQVAAGTTKKTTSTIVGAAKNPTEKLRGVGGPDYGDYYIRPITGGVKTQGLHGYNAVDLGTPIGSLVYAAAPGTIIISKSSGYNGGYGQYIVVQHPNNTQTLYGHLSANFLTEGTVVTRGQVIGLSGSTGKSTGPHVHFEVRGAVNPGVHWK